MGKPTVAQLQIDIEELKKRVAQLERLVLSKTEILAMVAEAQRNTRQFGPHLAEVR